MTTSLTHGERLNKAHWMVFADRPMIPYDDGDILLTPEDILAHLLDTPNTNPLRKLSMAQLISKLDESP